MFIFSKYKFDPFLICLSIVGHLSVIASIAYLSDLTSRGTDEPILLILLVNILIHSFGVTVGYHRYFTHRSFKTSRPFEIFLMFTALFAQQRGIKSWVARHRLHHKYSDTEKDPQFGDGSPFYLMFLSNYVLKDGIDDKETIDKYVPEYKDDALFNFFSSNWGQLLHLIGVYILLYALGGWTYLACHIIGWFYVFYMTTAVINGLTHFKSYFQGTVFSRFFYRNYNTKDETLNSMYLFPFILDDAYHHNHHRFPASFRMGRKKYEVELWYPIFILLEKFGIIWDLNHGEADKTATTDDILKN